MNLAEMRSVLTYIWSAHPNAPNIDDVSKDLTIQSYFRVLYMYDIQDVLEAVDRTCRESPIYIPSAYQIYKHCERTLNVQTYLTQAYYDEKERLEALRMTQREWEPVYQKALQKRFLLVGNVIISLIDDEKLEHLRKMCQPYEETIDTFRALSEDIMECEKRIEDLYAQAVIEANYEYDQKQIARASDDLKELTYE